MSLWLDRIEAKKSEEQYKKDLRTRGIQERKNKRIRASNAKAEAKHKKSPGFAPYQDKVAAEKRKAKKKQKAAEKRGYYGGY